MEELGDIENKLQWKFIKRIINKKKASRKIQNYFTF